MSPLGWNTVVNQPQKYKNSFNAHNFRVMTRCASEGLALRRDRLQTVRVPFEPSHDQPELALHGTRRATGRTRLRASNHAQRITENRLSVHTQLRPDIGRVVASSELAEFRSFGMRYLVHIGVRLHGPEEQMITRDLLLLSAN